MSRSSSVKKKNGHSRGRSPKKTSRRRWLPSLSLVLKAALCGVAILVAWTVYLDALITDTFNGKKWAIPAKVYARPVILSRAATLTPSALQAQLQRQGYQPVRKVSRPGTFSRTGNNFAIHIRAFQFPEGRAEGLRAEVTFDQHGISRLTSLGRDIPSVRLDPQLMGGIYPASHEDRILVHLNDVPVPLLKGLVVVEDRNFYNHHGISLKGIARAMLANVQAGGIVQGGSTLTQQLVKNFYLNNRRTLARKVEEALMSLLLELHYSKTDILETYLNEVYLGQQGQRAVHGIALASQFYFARPIKELDLSRQALLVALVKGPSWYNPRRFPERALARRNLVLDMFEQYGVASAAAVAQAKQRALGVVSRERLQANAFPAYIDLVKRQLRDHYRNSDLTSEGLKIFTNMDPIAQQQAQSTIDTTLRMLDRGKNTGLETAMVVTDTQTGEVRALVGGRDAGFAGFNRALDARRPIGSLVKPAVYLAALSNPESYTLATLLSDTPITVTGDDGQLWTPQNYDKKSHGQVPLYQALAKSYNQATAHLGMDIGVSEVLRTLEKMGLQRKLRPYPSLLLGALELSPLEVASLYQTLASGGYRMQLRAIAAVTNAQGQPLSQYRPSETRAISADRVALINFALQKTMTEGTGARAYRILPSSARLAGKTGTTDDRRDSWFAGYSGDTLAVSWIGRDDNAPTRYTGSSGALRVWSEFMHKQGVRSLPRSTPEDIAFYSIDQNSGLLGGSGCEDNMSLPFIVGSQPRKSAPCASSSPVKGVVDWFKALWD